MYHKLSNIAKKKKLEEEFKLPLEYGNLYTPSHLINGSNEETLLVITSDKRMVISPAIWGMLPEDFEDDWNIYQNVHNTLTLKGSSLISGNRLQKAFLNRRCLIIITGFFTAFMHDGTIHPYHVKMVSGKPFCIAGVYNRLEDGFATCSILTRDTDAFVKKIENISSQMPFILSSESWEKWLDTSISETELRQLLKSPCLDEMEANLIDRELFNQNIVYASMFDKVSHDKLPPAIRSKVY